MSRDSLSSSVDTLVRVGGLFVGAAYVLGFLVVATHHAQFGISDFTLLRPKILTAGTGLLALAGLSIATGLRAFSLAGLSGVGLPIGEHPSREREVLYLVRGIGLWGTCLAWGLFLAPLLFQDGPWQPWKRLPEYTAVFLAGGLTQIIERRSNLRPMLRVVAVIAVQLALGVYSWWFFAESVFWLGLWVVTIAWVSTLFAFWFKATEHLARKVQVESLLLLVGSGLLLWYSTSLYNRIQPWLGGGAPLRAEMSLREDLSFLPGREIQADLLDETSHGFYLIQSGHAAVFVPREAVKAAKFAYRDATPKD